MLAVVGLFPAPLPAQAPTASVAARLAADLQWTPTQREHRFARMDKLFPTNTIHHGPRTLALSQGLPLTLHLAGQTLRQRMQHDRLAGVLVLQHGRIRLEAYGLHTTPHTRWTSFSVAKSFTSTLVGAAIARGSIHSLDDPLTAYLPELRATAYDGVTLRQLLTMSTGVRWVEDYTAPGSDNVRLYQTPGPNPVLDYMRRLPRAHPPGTVFNYNTGEADLLGVLLRRATGLTLAAQLTHAIWQPAGMQQNATWIADAGQEFAGSGISAILRDYARFGLFALKNGAGITTLPPDSAHSTTRTLPPTWFANATRTAFPTDTTGRGYAMGWWTYPDGTVAALGIFGQSLRIDPRRDTVTVLLGAWPQATSAALIVSRNQLWQAIDTALDAETPTSTNP